MSTTIDVLPATDVYPLVEQTRARTEELFQQFLDRYDVGSRVAVTAFVPNKTAAVEPVSLDVRWSKGLDVGFTYWIDGVPDSRSWPSCEARDMTQLIEPEDVRSSDNPGGVAPEFLGAWDIVIDIASDVDPVLLARILCTDHVWYEYRNGAGPAVASTGYGLSAAALAEATDGVLASWDGAFDERPICAGTAQEFLRWWGDRQMAFYGIDRFRTARSR